LSERLRRDKGCQKQGGTCPATVAAKRLLPGGACTIAIIDNSRFVPMLVALETVDQPEVIQLISALDAYQGALYPAESNYHLSVEALKAPNVLFAVARAEDGVVIGCGAIVLFDGYGELKRMFVPPAQRGRGVAKAIMAFLEAHAVQRNCHLLRLETGIHQPEAHGLYSRAGYTRRGPYGDYPDDPLSVFMEKRIAVTA
jgi:putative acetyltransferase